LHALTLLEAAERTAAPWSGAHCDAALMLVAQRIKTGLQDERDGPAASEALLIELVEGVGLEEKPMISTANGQTFEAGTIGRMFLASLLAADPARQADAARWSEAAEARKSEVLRAVAARNAAREDP
jgi:hypothetical protein